MLDVVKKELPIIILSLLDNVMHLGRGESACMVYCRYHNDVVGSSNTKDITDYCDEFGITYLTTNDFLYYAIHRGLLSKSEAVAFIEKVRSMGSNPPVVDLYHPCSSYMALVLH